MNEVKVAEGAVEASTKSGLSRGKKVGIVVCASLLTVGAIYGIVRLTRHFKARKAAQEGDSATK